MPHGATHPFICRGLAYMKPPGDARYGASRAHARMLQSTSSNLAKARVASALLPASAVTPCACGPPPRAACGGR